MVAWWSSGGMRGRKLANWLDGVPLGVNGSSSKQVAFVESSA